VDISAVVVLDETTLQATVNPPPEGGNGVGGDGGASLSDAIPQPLGTAAAGIASTGSRSDHRHAMPTAAQVGAEATGTAAAAVAAHAAAADPHSIYTTPAEAAAAAPVQSVSLSAPSGWSSSTNYTGGNVVLTLGLPTGFSLPSNTSQANWDTAHAERLRWDGGAGGLVAATGRASLELAAVAASGAYGDLSGRPILGTAAATDATAYATAAQGGKADTAVQPAALTSGLAGKADLIGGLVPTSQIPAIALVEYLGSVANQSAMLALRGQGGDWCIRADTATEWVIVANNGASLADWIQLPTGIAPVSSINGQTGAVTLGTGDLSESGGNLFFTASRAIGSALTGFVAGAGTVAATDSILQAINKIVGNIAAKTQVSSSAPAALAATAAAGSSTDAARADHAHARSTYAELGAIADGIVFTISNRGETATASTNYDESLPLSFAVTITKITFITHIDNTGSSTTTLSAYKRTAAGTKTALLSANATLASGASVATGSLSGTAGVLSLAAGDRFGVDLIGLGTGASGIKCIIEYTRSAA
jgi:hypothetical protein